MRPSQFANDQRGAVSFVTALLGVALIGFAGLATDVGSVYLQSRRLQGTVDLAALSAAQNPNRAESLVRATLQANLWTDEARIAIQSGRYTPDPALAANQRFAPGAAQANAVHVSVTSSAPLYFARLFIPTGRMNITRQATAAQTRLASFQIGSRLLSLNGGVANALLGGLTGSNVSLSVMDYNALVSADVDLLSYVDALRTRMDIEAATFDETLSHRTDAPEALDALADVLAHSDARAEAAIRQLARAAHGGRPLNGLDDLIDLGPYAGQDVATDAGSTRIAVSAMDLATAILQIAGGDRQVRLQLGAGLPGLASTNVWLAIGERPNNSPWLSVTNDSDVIIRTAQTRLYIESDVRPVGGLLNAASVRIPILIEAAAAQARLSDVTCGFEQGDRAVTLSVAPSVGSLSLGQINTARLDNFRAALNVDPAELVRVGAVRIEGAAHVDLGGEAWQDVRFSGDDIDRGAIKTVQTRDIARASVSSLIGQTRLNVRAAGLGIAAPGLGPATQSVLNSAAAPLDSLVNGLTDLLGVHLGEADVRVNGVRCGGAALVA